MEINQSVKFIRLLNNRDELLRNRLNRIGTIISISPDKKYCRVHFNCDPKKYVWVIPKTDLILIGDQMKDRFCENKECQFYKDYNIEGRNYVRVPIESFKEVGNHQYQKFDGKIIFLCDICTSAVKLVQQKKIDLNWS